MDCNWAIFGNIKVNFNTAVQQQLSKLFINWYDLKQMNYMKSNIGNLKKSKKKTRKDSKKI